MRLPLAFYKNQKLLITGFQKFPHNVIGGQGQFPLGRIKYFQFLPKMIYTEAFESDFPRRKQTFFNKFGWI